MEKIKNVLRDAERRRIDDETIQSWLSELKEVLYDTDDIIDLCSIKGRQMLAGDQLPSTSSSTSRVRRRFPSLLSCCTSAASIPFRHEIGKEIEKITSRLEEIDKDRQQFKLDPSIPVVVPETRVNLRDTTSLPPPNVVGREVEHAMNKLVGWLQEEKESSLYVYAIVGTGGIGKTTLAQKIYHHQDLKSTFEFKSWVCVSQNYDETKLLKQLIRQAGGKHGIDDLSKEELLCLLNTTVSGKRFLLVLDDVWQADVWEHLLQTPLQNGGHGSRILVTTRNNDVSKDMQAFNTYQVNKLCPDDGWRLLSSIVFKNETDECTQDLRNIGTQIVEKCDGLPLAIKVIAGVLRKKSRSSHEWMKVFLSHAWSMEGNLPEEVRGALYLSYEVLPSPLKQCFLHFSLFPEDHNFNRDDLIRMWVSEGFVSEQKGLILEDIAEDYYTELMNRNLLLMDPGYVDNYGCKMHDLVRSLAIFLARDESFYIESGGSSTKTFTKIRRLGIGSELESVVNLERLRSLLLFESGENVNMEDLFDKLRHLRVLHLRASSIDSIPSSVRNLQHLRYLDLSQTEIRELPESIGCLTFLLMLNLSYCNNLHALPKSITGLYNLRCLGLGGTELSHIPAGIGKLEKLNDIDGFVVGDDGYNQEDEEQQQQGMRQRGCGLDELQSLSQIRRIWIEKLGRVPTTSRNRIRPLEDKAHLKELQLSWSEPDNAATEEDLMRVEQIFEDLSPSPTLETLEIYYYYGVKFPGWMAMLPNLTDLRLFDCFNNCTQLPPLGHLPQLQNLEIEGATSETRIGVECVVVVGCSSDTNSSGATQLRQQAGALMMMTAFPKLEVLELRGMRNLEEWTWDTVEASASASASASSGSGGGGENINIIRLLPRLKELLIIRCPKLRALPNGLQHASALKTLSITDAKSLMEVDSLLSLETLTVIKCPNMVTISNLPSLEKLYIEDCRALVSIENANALQRLILVDRLMECFPEWLLGLIRNSVKDDNGTLRTFNLWRCNPRLGGKCREGGEYWSLLQHIQQVDVKIEYTPNYSNGFL